jgi:Transcriptional regulator
MSSDEIAMRRPRQDGYTPQPGHARQKRLEGWKLVAALSGVVVASLVVSAGTIVGWTLANLTTSIQTVELPGYEEPALAGVGEWEGGFNVLVVGSDTRVGQGDQFGETDGELNDVNLLVHVSENHDHATVISFPRDTLVDVPGCEQEDGSLSSVADHDAAEPNLEHWWLAVCGENAGEFDWIRDWVCRGDDVHRCGPALDCCRRRGSVYQ